MSSFTGFDKPLLTINPNHRKDRTMTMSLMNSSTSIPNLRLLHQGKVRDTFEVPNHPDLLLVVASDRVSTHNIVHLSQIFAKGQVLTALTIFWMLQHLMKYMDTHLVAYGKKIYDFFPFGTWPGDLHLRAIIVKRLDMIDAEFHYQSIDGKTCFIPIGKSDAGEPLTADLVAHHNGDYGRAHRLTLNAYDIGRCFAAKQGFTILNAKFKVGLSDSGRVTIADEFLTPDCCHFALQDDIQSWHGKQLRAEAERMWGKGEKVPLQFPQKVCYQTAERNEEFFRRLTGYSLFDFQQKHFH